MNRIAVVGRGVVGDRIVRRLPTVVPRFELVAVDPRRIGEVPADAEVPAGVEVAVLAQGGAHAPAAAAFLNAGTAVVSVSDDLDDVRALLDLDDLARSNGVPIVVGAGMSSGLTGLLARMLADQLASCDEIHVAIHGTAGPACARSQHDALGGRAVGFVDGTWIQRRAGSGRELTYFPEPVGPYDCYRAELTSPILLRDAFPEALRLSARVSANRRDRLTARLPMLTPPHREGGIGAVRVEVRGNDAAGGRETLIAGVAELVGTATAATAIAFVAQVLNGRVPAGVCRAGDASLDTLGLLHDIGQAGVRLQEFTGVPSEQRISANP